MAIEKVRTFLRERGFEDRVLEFDVSSATVELAAQAVGCEPERIAKTLSFYVGDRVALIVAAGDARIDNPSSRHNSTPRRRCSGPRTQNRLLDMRWAAFAPLPSTMAATYTLTHH